MYYPLLKPYSSLYPNAKQEKNKTDETTDNEDSRGQVEEVLGPKGDHDMWRSVEEAMKSGTLVQLRNSQPEGMKRNMKMGSQDRDNSKGEKRAQGNNRASQKHSNVHVSTKAKEDQEEEEEEESDGGFFEWEYDVCINSRILEGQSSSSDKMI